VRMFVVGSQRNILVCLKVLKAPGSHYSNVFFTKITNLLSQHWYPHRPGSSRVILLIQLEQSKMHSTATSKLPKTI
jgi:hypothetical protein